MPPDFNQKTIDTLGRRAAFKCSNPDCRIATVGPSTDQNKATVLGEAAHIFGARPKSKRYNSRMDDRARAEITNGIWLCRNCHKLVDSDEQKFTAKILFAWREIHEKYVLTELGSSTDRLRFEQRNSALKDFEEYPPLIRRIVLDKPRGWEWSLTAALMRYLNEPIFRRIADLRDGLYMKPQHHLSAEDVTGWVQDRMAEFEKLVTPFSSLMQRLCASWGELGEEGDVGEIHHMCRLIRDMLEQVVIFEEQIYFTNVPAEYVGVLDSLKEILSSQAVKLAEIPVTLDEIVATIAEAEESGGDAPKEYTKIIEFDLPKKKVRQIIREVKRANRVSGVNSNEEGVGCWTTAFVIVVVIWIIGALI